MAKFPTYEEMAKNVAEKALDDFCYEGKTIREWIQIIAEQEPCKDCVSREKVWSMITSGKYPNENDEQFIDRLVEELEKMPSVTPTQNWIPVSERLPEKSTWVLVTCKNSDGYIFLDIQLINQYTGLWEGEDEDFSGTVLAWMPLPKPYESQENEEA